MKQPRNFKEAAKVAYEERWLPISQAKTIIEMGQILKMTECGLCALQRRRHGKGFCKNCPLNDYHVDYCVCCVEWKAWVYILFNTYDFNGALKWARKICNRLKRIAEIN